MGGEMTPPPTIVATSGHRERSRWPHDFASGWISVCNTPSVRELRFGGAEGWDTWALRQAAAHRAHLLWKDQRAYKAVDREPPTVPTYRLVVIVPNRVTDLEGEAHRAVNDCVESVLGDDLVELRLVENGASWRDALLRRNTALLLGGRREGDRLVVGQPAELLYACWDGGKGGTADTVRKANERGIRVVVAGRRAA